ncbi:MAG TPA: DUF2723 domain-containing protein [Gemmatimonadales bacterium]|nr:DUF2723 domain-containing protein [Gemmatimonadales bacterium]
MTEQTEINPTPYRYAALTGLIVLGIYLLTLAPTTALWDTSEYLAAAYTLGIPHPPGNPLFTLLAHTWGALPLSDSYAVRINIFAAVTSAASAALWFLVAERWMREVVPVRWARLAAAFAGTLVSATSWTVWNQSTVNEKVYTVSMFSTALVVWLGVHWGDDEPGPHRDRWLVLIAYIITISSTNHMMGVLGSIAVATYVLWTDWRLVLKPWVLMMGLTLALCVSGLGADVITGPSLERGLILLAYAAILIYTAAMHSAEFRKPIFYLGTVAVLLAIGPNYLFLPIRAAQYPPINEGEPIGYFSQALMDVLNRVQYGKPPLFQRQADLVSQIGNYLQYFNWQFARDWRPLTLFFTGVFALLGLFGAFALWQKDKRAAAASTALMGTLTIALIYYLNFKYGFSYRPEESGLAREVRERDYFFVVSFAAFGLWVSVGFGALMSAIAESLQARGTPHGRWIAATPVLGLALVPLLGNRVSASRAHETMARDVAVDLLESVEPYSILITAGDNDTFPLWYAQEVEHVRPDVTLANLSLMNTTWHLKQLSRRVTPEFDPSKAAPIWRYGTWKRPTKPALQLTTAQIDSLPEISRVPKNSGVAFDSLRLAFGQEYLELKDLATLFMIRDNIGMRPVYFSWSDGGYPDQTFNLTPYLVSAGLARRLVYKPVVASDTIVLNRGLGYVDYPRNNKLLWDTYHWQTAARKRPYGWVDPPSASILQMYSIVFGGSASSMREKGDSVLASRADSVARAVQLNFQPDVR